MKKIVIIILSLCLICLGLFRYKSINDNTPSEITEEKYDIGQWIKLNKYELRVDSFRTEIDKYSKNVIVMNVSIKNITDKDINNVDILREFKASKAMLDIYGSDYIGNYDTKGLEERLKPGDTEKINIGISLAKVANKAFNDSSKKIKFYINTSWYDQEVKKHFSDKEIYVKYVKLR